MVIQLALGFSKSFMNIPELHLAKELKREDHTSRMNSNVLGTTSCLVPLSDSNEV